MMGKYGVFSIAILLTIASITNGRPTEVSKGEKVRSWRLEVELLRATRPCHARLLEVRTDMEEFGDIQEDPHYVPDCDPEGVLWKPAQCDHHDAGSCFCVRETDGSVMNHTVSRRLNKEALKCGRRVGFNAHTDHMCFHMQDEFYHMQKEFGLQGHSPLAYFPDCTKKGKFVAMQRDGNSNFFCVDTETGDIIPDTMITAGRLPPLNVYICEAYDKVWQEFKTWNATEERKLEETVTKESCKKGFTFSECGCPKICTAESKVNEQSECVCKPACLCPEGKWELDGECVSLEECHEASPNSGVLFAQKVEALSAGKFSRWQQYQIMNPNKVLETYNSIESPSEESGGPIASDVDPNAVSFFHEGPPPEEELPQDGQESHRNKSHERNESSVASPPQGNFFGAERIPLTGERRNILGFVLGRNGLYSPREIGEIIETGTRPGPTTLPPEEIQPTEFDPFAESFESSESVEEENIESYGNTNEDTPFYYDNEPTPEPSSETTEGNYYDYDRAVEYTETNGNHESEVVENNEETETTQEYYFEYGNVVESNETNTTTEEYFYYTENEEDGEEIEETEDEDSEEYSNENPKPEKTKGEPEIESVEYSTQSTLPPERFTVETMRHETLDRDNTGGISPTENTQDGNIPEEENNERYDEELNGQKKLTSVPRPSNDEERDHTSTPPCEEVDNQHETSKPTTATAEALTLIERIVPEKVAGNFKNESPSIKKSING